MKIHCNLCLVNGQDSNMALVALERHLRMGHAIQETSFEHVIEYYTQTQVADKEVFGGD